MNYSIRLGIGAIALCTASAASATAQGRGDYLNFESPQVKPIAVGSVDGHRYLFVCNTPDNSVDVFSLDRMEMASEQVTGFPTLLPADPDAVPADRGYAARIPVGLEPVSLTIATIQVGTEFETRLYTANWLGDSVTYVRLRFDTSAPDEELAFSYEIERVVHVGDEPMCVAVMNSGSEQHLFVSKRTASSYSQLHPTTGAFELINDSLGSVGNQTGNGYDAIMSTSGVFANALDPTALDEGTFLEPAAAPEGVMAVKEPHTLAAVGRRLWVLGQQGGGSKLFHDEDPLTNPGGEVAGFNLDLWSVDVATNESGTAISNLRIIPPMSGGSAAPATAGTGTTNFNLAANSNWVYVVSTDAMNGDIGNPTLLTRSTGFVRTLLCKINASTGAVSRRDLNTYATSSPGSGGPVTKAESLAHCTDVTIFRGQKVCVVAFNSDRFAIVDTSASAMGQPMPQAWTIELTNITASNDDDGSQSGVNVAGPRAVAVALDPAFPTGGTTRPGDRIYVLNRLDHSISVIDPNQAPASRQVFGFALPNDPVPDYVRRGQQFLYSAALGSSSGFVSCASCHIDGRSDQLQWRLSSEDTDLPLSIHAPLDILVENHELPLTTTACVEDDLDPSDGDGDGFPSMLADDRSNPVDELASATCSSHQSATDNGKGPMITQSLQGLLNFEVASGSSLVTNAPYHWRGDKPDFEAFNEAFVGLQGLPDLIDGNASTEPNAGLTPQEMADYTTFVNSIHYPPNPLQPRDREYGGDPWSLTTPGPDLINPNVAGAGSGTLLGLKLFHILPTPGLRDRSCVQCHFLPEGSNNRPTFIRLAVADNQSLYPADLKFQPIESAALRGLTQKEGRLELDPGLSLTSGTNLRTGDLGLGHDGLEGFTRNDFLTVVLQNIPDDNHGAAATILVAEGIEAINDFVRRIDHGVAPIVGRSLSLSQTELPGQPQFSQAKLDLLADMEQQVKAANSGLAVYARVSGVERRFWYDVTSAGFGLEPEYQESPSTGNTLDRSELFGLLGSADLLIFLATPLGSDLRVASASGVGETLAGTSSMPTNLEMIETRPNLAYRLIPTLTANLTDADNPNHGLPPKPPALSFQEEAPDFGEFRSLDVLDMLQDCVLAGDDNVNTHDAPRRLRVVAEGLVHGARIRLHVPNADSSISVLEMPIYPTNEFVGGDRVWETAVELDPLNVYALRLGGFDVSGVRAILDGGSTEFDVVPPATFTWELQNAASGWNSGQAEFRYTLANP